MAKQTCEQCGVTTEREADAPRLTQCPACRAPLPQPHVITPKSGAMGASGGTR